MRAGFKAPVAKDIRSRDLGQAVGQPELQPDQRADPRHAGGHLPLPADARSWRRRMMGEAQRVAEELGVRFKITLEQRIAGAEAVGAHKTSMLQDVEHGRALELEALVGAVVELGRITGRAHADHRRDLRRHHAAGAHAGGAACSLARRAAAGLSPARGKRPAALRPAACRRPGRIDALPEPVARPCGAAAHSRYIPPGTPLPGRRRVAHALATAITGIQEPWPQPIFPSTSQSVTSRTTRRARWPNTGRSRWMRRRSSTLAASSIRSPSTSTRSARPRAPSAA